MSDERDSTWAEARQAIFELSAIQLDTLKALAAGLSVPEVAALRYLSIDTVKSQRKQLYRRMSVDNGYLAIARGYHWNILDPDVPPELALEQHERYPPPPVPKEPAKPRRERVRKPVTPREDLQALRADVDALYKRFPALAMLDQRARRIGPVVREDEE